MSANLPVPLVFVPRRAPVARPRWSLGLSESTQRILRLVLSLVTVVAAGIVLCWEMAIAFLATLLLHEIGHHLGLKRCGLPTRDLTLVPFVSSLLTSHGTPRTRGEEALVSAMGPSLALFGLPVIFAGTALLQGAAFAAAVTTVCALYSLITLLPVVPLDGGRILKAVSFSVHSALGRAVLALGPAVAVATIFLAGTPWIAVVLPFAFFEVVRDLRDPPFGMRSGGMALALAWWAILVALYGTLAIALAFVPGVDAASERLFRI